MRFDPAGFCIYCTTKEAKLTNEHIVPFGLNGELELPDASCKECAKITGAIIEQKVIKQTFPYLRFRYNLRTRRPKERPKHFTIGCGNRSIVLPNSELPHLTWAMPVFAPPGIIDGRSPDNTGSRSIRAQMGMVDAERLLASGGGSQPINMDISKIDENAFRRMIAKIAHSFTFAILRDSFTPLLNETILKGVNSSYLIGSEQDDIFPDDTLYSIQLGKIEYLNRNYIAARVRIFGFLGTPVYIAIVGTAEKFTEIPASAFYVKTVKLNFV